MLSTDGTSTLSGSSGYEEYAFIADLYDHVAPYRDRPDVGFFVDAATRAGSPVLEIGCGTGRVLIPTARAGLDIVGLDLSPHMLAVCRQRLLDESEEIQKRVQLVQADMRHFSLDHRFTLVTIPFRPFQHLLTVEDQFSCLAQVHRHLVDDGVLLLDIFNPSLDFLVSPVGEECGDEPEFLMPDGRRVTCRHKTIARDRFNQINHFELIYYVIQTGENSASCMLSRCDICFGSRRSICWPAPDSRSRSSMQTTTRVHMAQSIRASSCSWQRRYESEQAAEQAFAAVDGRCDDEPPRLKRGR